jgi:hypothetical protein
VPTVGWLKPWSWWTSSAPTAAWMTTELGEKMLGYYLEAGSDACRLGLTA